MSSPNNPNHNDLEKALPKTNVGHSIPKLSESVRRRIIWRKSVNILILCFGNFLNYTDRYIVAGILIDIQEFFNIRNDKAGLIQTIFVVIYMVSAPVFGFFGDRYDRKILLASAILLWNAANITCSFMDTFWAFLLVRGVLGFGQACYTTVAPGIISDLYVGEERSKMLVLFYSAIPLGSGMSYIVGTQMSEAFNSWKWSLRATPVISIIVLIIIMFFLKNPKRGHSEGTTHLKSTSWIQDMMYLLKNRSFMLTTMGFTTLLFSTGAISWWAPTLILMGFQTKGAKINPHTAGTIYGFIAAAAGLLGLSLGHLLTLKLKPKYPQIDPFVCAIALFISGPILMGTSYAATYNEILCYALLFVGLAMINLNWAIICDIILCVVLPCRRSLAVGLQLLIGHAFGDAGSPYLLGLISEVIYDYIKSEHTTEDVNSSFKALQYSFFIACGVVSLGAPIFLLTTCYIISDREKVLRGE